MSLNSLFKKSLIQRKCCPGLTERAGLETFKMEVYDRATRRPKTQRHVARCSIQTRLFSKFSFSEAHAKLSKHHVEQLVKWPAAYSSKGTGCAIPYSAHTLCSTRLTSRPGQDFELPPQF